MITLSSFKNFFKYGSYHLTISLCFSFCIFAQDSSPSANQLWTSGIEAYTQLNYKAAIKSFTSLIEKYPSNEHFLDVNKYLAQSYQKTGDDSKAVPYYKAYLETSSNNPQSYEVRLELAKVYSRLGQKSELFALTQNIIDYPNISSEMKESAILLRKNFKITSKMKLKKNKKSFKKVNTLEESKQ